MNNRFYSTIRVGSGPEGKTPQLQFGLEWKCFVFAKYASNWSKEDRLWMSEEYFKNKPMQNPEQYLNCVNS